MLGEKKKILKSTRRLSVHNRKLAAGSVLDEKTSCSELETVNDDSSLSFTASVRLGSVDSNTEKRSTTRQSVFGVSAFAC